MSTQEIELADHLFARYQRLQQYVGWTEADAERVRGLAPLVEPSFAELVEDFYAMVQGEPEAFRVITGGATQIARLKQTLVKWLTELFSGNYDRDYVVRRWQVGRRHVQIGLDQMYTNVALSRLRAGLMRTIVRRLLELGRGDEARFAVRSLNQLIDLDLAIIEDAYQAEYVKRVQTAERLGVLGRVAGGIAHELRNPLNVIRTSVYYLLNAKSPTPEKSREHLERIERQVSVADGVITALSDFAKLPLPELRALRVRDCLAEAIENSHLPSTIEVTLEIPDDLPPIAGDNRQLNIVFSNLIRNANDAMPHGGRLMLRAAVRGNWVEIAITDTGSGIKSDDLARIMEPLFSTKARGLGLGLAITRAIVERHGGGLSVESVEGQGSTFTVRLPPPVL